LCLVYGFDCFARFDFDDHRLRNQQADSHSPVCSPCIQRQAASGVRRGCRAGSTRGTNTLRRLTPTALAPAPCGPRWPHRLSVRLSDLTPPLCSPCLCGASSPRDCQEHRIERALAHRAAGIPRGPEGAVRGTDWGSGMGTEPIPGRSAPCRRRRDHRGSGGGPTSGSARHRC